MADETGTVYYRKHGLTEYRPLLRVVVDTARIPTQVSSTHTYLPADFNHDLKVSFADYLILEANFGKSQRTNAQGDCAPLDGSGGLTTIDGWVKFADYLVLEAEYGHTTTPEPATIGLLVAGGLAALRRRR
jgi:hypothetical protein